MVLDLMEPRGVQGGSGLPLWKPDYSVVECPLCTSEFGFFLRRHHCRNCGGIFCGECSSSKTRLTQLGYNDPVRVCNLCAREVYVPSSQKDADLKGWLLLVSNRGKLNRRLFQGVPNRARGNLWPQLSNAVDLVVKNPKVYERLLACKHLCQFQEQIDSDIQRTFPDYPLFKEANGVGQQALSNVLRCFSLYREDVGYSQGMNFIAAVLLIHLDEENAFWLFVQMMKQFSLDGLFTEGNPLLSDCLKQFDHWMHELLPDLHLHWQKLGISMAIFTSQWLRTLYSYNFPLEIIFRIWDIFFVEGMDFLIWVGLVLLDSCQDHLMQLDALQTMKFFKDLPETSFVALREHLNAPKPL